MKGSGIYMNNMDQRSKQKMLGVVSAKLGMSPQELQKQLESGKLDAAMKGLSAQDSAKLMNALSNPAMAQRILATPQAQEIIKKLKS